MRKEYLSVMTNRDGKFFILGAHGQLKDTPYFSTMKSATIYMMRLNSRKYKNLYSLSEKEYSKDFSQQEEE